MPRVRGRLVRVVIVLAVIEETTVVGGARALVEVVPAVAVDVLVAAGVIVDLAALARLVCLKRSV